jgi:hypothetical protein
MEVKHLVIICLLTVNNQEIPTDALINCGATGIAFLNQDFARHHLIPLQELKEKTQVEVIDRRPIESGDITLITKVDMKVQGFKEQLRIFIMTLGHYPIVRGIPGLGLHDVAVHFAPNRVPFESQYCITHCHDTSVTVQGVTEEPPEPGYQAKEIFELHIRPQSQFWGNNVMLNGSSSFQTVQKGRLTLFKASLYHINKTPSANDFKERPLEEILPERYQDFLPLCSKVLADRFPPY